MWNRLAGVAGGLVGQQGEDEELRSELEAVREVCNY